jgi:hypothetical protein
MKHFKHFLIIILLLSITISAQETVKIKPGALEGIDAWFWSFPKFKEYNWGVAREGNYGLHNVIRAEAWEWFNSGRTDTIRSAIKFDLSNLPAYIIIDSARLNLFYYSNEGHTKQEGQNHCVVERITEKWDEYKINWVNQPGTIGEDRILISPSENDSANYSIDVTHFIKFFKEYPDSNFGLMFKMHIETKLRGLTFASSDHVDEILHPELIINFRKLK